MMARGSTLFHRSDACPEVRRRGVPRAVTLAVLTGVALLPTASQASAATPPAWEVTVTPDANYFVPGPADKQAVYTIEAENVGEEPTSESDQVVIEDSLPAGLTAEGLHFYSETGFGLGFDLSSFICPSALVCEYPGPFAGFLPPLQPGQKVVMQVLVGVPSGSWADHRRSEGERRRRRKR